MTILSIEEAKMPMIKFDRMQGRPNLVIKVNYKEFDTGARINVRSRRILANWKRCGSHKMYAMPLS